MYGHRIRFLKKKKQFENVAKFFLSNVEKIIFNCSSQQVLLNEKRNEINEKYQE